jgi:hypothetical protein
LSEKLTDISGTPLEKGDLLLIEEGEERHKLAVSSVEEQSETVRKVLCTVINSSNTELHPNKRIFIYLDSTKVTMGVVIRPTVDEADVSFTEVEANVAIILELKKFLDSREEANFGAPNMIAANYLIRRGLLKGEAVKAKNKMLRLVNKRKDLFRSSGGYVFSTGIPDEAPHMSMSNNDVERLVDEQLAVQGFRLLMRSGLFGKIRLVNTIDD